MQRLEVSCAVRPVYGSLGAKGLILASNVKTNRTGYKSDIENKSKIYYSKCTLNQIYRLRRTGEERETNTRNP
jgi:hypothetical protein